MDTKELADWIVKDAQPVRRLSKPWLRTLGWLAIAMPYLAMVIVMMAPRPDLAQKLVDTRFLVEQLAALAVAIAAAFAAFTTVIPGWSRWPILGVSLLVSGWLASLGAGCATDWFRLGADGLSLRPDWICFPAIVISGAAPALSIVVMLRRGAPLRPGMSLALAGLAAAALGNFGLRFFHPQDAGLMVLVWQFGSVVLLSAIAGSIGAMVLPTRRMSPLR